VSCGCEAFLDHNPQINSGRGTGCGFLYRKWLRGMERWTMSEQRDENGVVAFCPHGAFRLAVPNVSLLIRSIRCCPYDPGSMRTADLECGLKFVENRRSCVSSSEDWHRFLTGRQSWLKSSERISGTACNFSEGIRFDGESLHISNSDIHSNYFSILSVACGK
jgi:hypothetical protein